jgi:antagonist of KipI
MRVIEVVSPGLLTTVQDLGRPGYGALGVSASGAADAVSLRIGNRLAGTDEGAAALEMTLLGGTFRFPEGGIIALAGSDFGATLDGEPVELWTAFHVKPGGTLRVGATLSGARCYLCVQGGIAVPLFLGSASTHLLSGLGGYEGRALRKGDVLAIGELLVGNRRGSSNRQIPPEILSKIAPRKTLRVTPGPQFEWFSQAARKVFATNAYVVSEESNRMGLRLEGPALPDANHGEMISEGVAIGAVQIAAGGKPIILFVEQQTTGGYAKIANVISADLCRVGQLRPRDEIRFQWVEFGEARRLLMQHERIIRKLTVGS